MNNELVGSAVLDREAQPFQDVKSAYKASNTEILREYEIHIKFLNRGCIVNVGCKTIAFESVENAMIAVNAYVTNPHDEQEKWRQILK
jgi:hypothetical protein